MVSPYSKFHIHGVFKQPQGMKYWGVRWVLIAQSCLTLCDPMDCVAYQAPLSIELSRQEYWSELPFFSPGDLPDPGIKPGSPVLQANYWPCEPPDKPSWNSVVFIINKKTTGKWIHAFQTCVVQGSTAVYMLVSVLEGRERNFHKMLEEFWIWFLVQRLPKYLFLKHKQQE